MSPNLGIIASSISGHLSTTAFDSIMTATPTSGSTYTFNSIPQTYKHLQVVCLFANNRVGGETGSGSFFLNGDTTQTNYWLHALYAQSAGTPAAFNANYNYGIWWYGSTTTIIPAVYEILDYTNSNKKKTVQCLTGYDKGTAGGAAEVSFAWSGTGAVTSITFDLAGQTFVGGAHLALYGIKG